MFQDKEEEEVEEETVKEKPLVMDRFTNIKNIF